MHVQAAGPKANRCVCKVFSSSIYSDTGENKCKRCSSSRVWQTDSYISARLKFALIYHKSIQIHVDTWNSNCKISHF